MENSTTIDYNGYKVTWKHRPIFDEPRIGNILPPYEIPSKAGNTINIHPGFYDELMNLLSQGKGPVLIDQNDSEYVIDHIQVKEDFFEDLYTVSIRCKDDVVDITPITGLRKKTHTFSHMMMQQGGIVVKDPLSPVILKL